MKPDRKIIYTTALTVILAIVFLLPLVFRRLLDRSSDTSIKVEKLFMTSLTHISTLDTPPN